MEGRIAPIYENISRILKQEIVNDNRRDFIIVGYEYYGMLVEKMLVQQYNIIPKMIVDDNLSKYNSKIHSFDEMKKIVGSDDVVILTDRGVLNVMDLEQPPPPLHPNGSQYLIHRRVCGGITVFLSADTLTGHCAMSRKRLM